MNLDELLAAGWSLHQDEGFLAHVGPILERRGAGDVRLGFIAEAKHANRAGFVQGGMLATLADRTLGLTARLAEPSRSQATVELDIKYLDTARMGDFVTARAEVLRETSTLAFLSGRLEAEGRLIASVSGIWRIRPGSTRRSRSAWRGSRAE